MQANGRAYGSKGCHHYSQPNITGRRSLQGKKSGETKHQAAGINTGRLLIGGKKEAELIR